jgi:hypothetical protein
MKRVAHELMAVARSITAPQIVFMVERGRQDCKSGDYNNFHFDLQEYVDRIRRVEGLDAVVARRDTAAELTLAVSLSAHESIADIFASVVKKAKSFARKYGIKEISVIDSQFVLKTR